MMHGRPARLLTLGLAVLSGIASLATPIYGQQQTPTAQHEKSQDMETIHRLFAQNRSIRRTVRKRPDGVEAWTESRVPKVTAMLQAHVQAMHARLQRKQPMREWDPLFAALFRHADKIQWRATNTRRGVRILATSDDPYTVKLLHAHTQAVSGFVKEGMEGMAKRHEVPGAPRQPETAFLGKGDGVRTCPVTGMPVDRQKKAVLQGRTVYFCCASCVEVARKNPARYVRKHARL